MFLCLIGTLVNCRRHKPGCPLCEGELCVATQVDWVSPLGDKLFVATQLHPSLCKVQDLGVDPRSVPQEHSLCLTRDLILDPSSVPQEFFPMTQDLMVDPRSVP